jgi:hypothetical protein
MLVFRDRGLRINRISDAEKFSQPTAFKRLAIERGRGSGRVLSYFAGLDPAGNSHMQMTLGAASVQTATTRFSALLLTDFRRKTRADNSILGIALIAIRLR